MVPLTMPGHPQHGVSGQRLGQRADHRDGAGHGGFEVQVDMGVFGGLRQLAGGHRHQRLVGGDDRLALFQRGEDRLARGFDRPISSTTMSTSSRDTSSSTSSVSSPIGTPRSSATRRTPIPRSSSGAPMRAVRSLGALLDDADHLGADVAQPQHRYTDRLFDSSLTSVTSRLNRSSTVSLRRIRRARPSRTATTAGRPIRL